MAIPSRFMRAIVLHLSSNLHPEWQDFVDHPSPDPFGDGGWFHVTVGATGLEGGNDFQVCVATPRAIRRFRHAGASPGIVIERFDAASVRQAIHARIESIEGATWDDIVQELRTFMCWEYEGMAT